MGMALKSVFLNFLLLLTVAAFLGGCGTNCCNPGGTDSLEQLQALRSVPQKCKEKMNGVRRQAIEETALSIGAQAALAARAKQINCMLDRNSKTLDRIFNFNLMMLPHNVLPPVLAQGENTLNLADNLTIRIADRTYEIVSQARFVTTPPSWRDYLWLAYAQPDCPFGSLLPQNAEEQCIWDTFTAQGWQQGINQGNQIYAANLARLKRDFIGMVRYRTLLAQHMVSPPFVARTDLGITGSCSDMRINDQVLRITALPCLQTDSRGWRAIVDP